MYAVNRTVLLADMKPLEGQVFDHIYNLLDEAHENLWKLVAIESPTGMQLDIDPEETLTLCFKFTYVGYQEFGGQLHVYTAMQIDDDELPCDVRVQYVDVVEKGE